MLVAHATPEHRGVIACAYVVPEFRRQGILRELEIDASSFLCERSCVVIGFDLDSGNHAAREAWTALGCANWGVLGKTAVAVAVRHP